MQKNHSKNAQVTNGCLLNGDCFKNKEKTIFLH